MEPIRVFIADDHELVRYALRTLVEAQPDMEVVGEASDSEEAIARCGVIRPDVLLLDLRMPGVGGVEVCRQTKASSPTTSVLVLTSFDGDEEVFGAVEAGASGFLLKGTRPDRVIEAVRALMEGESVFDSNVATRVITGRSGRSMTEDDVLSDRELEVLRLMAKGLSNRDIGRALWIGETTVKTHVSHILHKLGVPDRTQAVLAAVRSGLVRLTE